MGENSKTERDLPDHSEMLFKIEEALCSKLKEKEENEVREVEKVERDNHLLPI
jgi:hypothetical protein